MTPAKEQDKEDSIWRRASGIIPEEVAVVLTYCCTYPTLN